MSGAPTPLPPPISGGKDFPVFPDRRRAARMDSQERIGLIRHSSLGDAMSFEPTDEDADDPPPTAADLYEDLVDLEATLKELARRADHRETQYLAMLTIDTWATRPLRTGFGADVDKALIKPTAAATLLMRALQRAQNKVHLMPEDIDDLVRCTDRLRQSLGPAKAELRWVMGQPNE